jgi:hypothetical protein
VSARIDQLDDPALDLDAVSIGRLALVLDRVDRPVEPVLSVLGDELSVDVNNQGSPHK